MSDDAAFDDVDAAMSDLYGQVSEIVEDHPLHGVDNVHLKATSNDFGDAKFIQISAYKRD